MCPTVHQQSAPLGAQSFPSRALTQWFIFTVVLLLLPSAHLCALMTAEAQAKLQEKDESEKVSGASCCGSRGHCASGLSASVAAPGQHCSGVAAWASYGLLGTESTPV